MDDCTDLSLKTLGKSIKSIPLLIKGILIELEQLFKMMASNQRFSQGLHKPLQLLQS